MQKRIQKTISTAILAVLAVFVAWTAWANGHPRLTEYTVESDRLPPAFEGFRIAQVSDLHNAVFGKENRRLMRTLERARADIIVITGDVIDSSRTDVDAAIALVRHAVTLAPCYYVTGNHEAWVSGETFAALEERLRDLGVTVLHDEAVAIECRGAHLTLVGIDDPDHASARVGMSSEHLQQLISDPEDFHILLAHRPEYFAQYVRAGFDTVFSGHAHGGQFRLPLLGGLIAPGQGLFPTYDAGRFTEGRTTMIVSRGIGNSIIPVRINNRPEIVVAELTAA